jgi:hypothetical protein
MFGSDADWFADRHRSNEDLAIYLEGQFGFGPQTHLRLMADVVLKGFPFRTKK